MHDRALYAAGTAHGERVRCRRCAPCSSTWPIPRSRRRSSTFPSPSCPGAAWARVAVSAGGICGSDLHLFAHNTGPSPTLMGMAARSPSCSATRSRARVVEAGRACPLAVGTRVALDPCIPCAAPRHRPAVRELRAGLDVVVPQPRQPHRQRRPHRSASPRVSAAGGPSRCWPTPRCCTRIPDAGSRPGRQPLRTGLDRLPRPPARAAARRRARAGRRRRHHRPRQPGRAEGALPGVPGHGAGPSRPPGRGRGGVRRGPRRASASAPAATSRSWRASSGARVVGRKANVMLMGGFPYVVEAVGAPQSVTEALRAVAHRGTVLLLGAAGVSEVDLTPIWYKEAALVGSIDHTVDARLRTRARRRARPSLGRPRPRRAGRRPAPRRRRRHPRVRARGLPRGGRDRDRPRQLPRHQGRVPSVAGSPTRIARPPWCRCALRLVAAIGRGVGGSVVQQQREWSTRRPR